MIDPVTLGFGLAAAATFGFALATKWLYGRWDAVLLASVFAATFLGSKVIIYTLGPWANISASPALDLACAVVAAALFIEKREKWKLAILFALLTKVMLHFAYVVHGDKGLAWDYMLARNILYAMELLCVTWPGGRAIGDRVFGSGSHHRRRPGDLVPAPRRTSPPAHEAP